MAEPSEADKAKAGALWDAAAQAATANCMCFRCGPDCPRAALAVRAREGIAAALAAAREEGRRDERRACWELAERCAVERRDGLAACIEAGGAVDALRGKLSEARRIRGAIAGRGPMGEP